MSMAVRNAAGVVGLWLAMAVLCGYMLACMAYGRYELQPVILYLYAVVD